MLHFSIRITYLLILIYFIIIILDVIDKYAHRIFCYLLETIASVIFRRKLYIGSSKC